MHRAVHEINVRRQVVRDAALADALGDAGARALLELAAGGDVGMQDAARWVREVGFDAAARGGFEVARHARQGAARAGGAGEGVEVAGGLVPDFRAGGLEVGAPVGDVVELVRPDRVWGALGVAFGLVVVVFRVVEGDGGDGEDFGAEEA